MLDSARHRRVRLTIHPVALLRQEPNRHRHRSVDTSTAKVLLNWRTSRRNGFVEEPNGSGDFGRIDVNRRDQVYRDTGGRGDPFGVAAGEAEQSNAIVLKR